MTMFLLLEGALMSTYQMNLLKTQGVKLGVNCDEFFPLGQNPFHKRPITNVRIIALQLNLPLVRLTLESKYFQSIETVLDRSKASELGNKIYLSRKTYYLGLSGVYMAMIHILGKDRPAYLEYSTLTQFITKCETRAKLPTSRKHPDLLEKLCRTLKVDNQPEMTNLEQILTQKLEQGCTILAIQGGRSWEAVVIKDLEQLHQERQSKKHIWAVQSGDTRWQGENLSLLNIWD